MSMAKSSKYLYTINSAMTNAQICENDPPLKGNVN